MGHTNCGAVAATIDALRKNAHPESLGSLRSIVDRIRPAIEGLLNLNIEEDQLMEQAVRSNTRISTNALKYGSSSLERMTEEDNLLIISAEYCLETGKVEFFDGVPNEDSSTST